MVSVRLKLFWVMLLVTAGITISVYGGAEALPDQHSIWNNKMIQWLGHFHPILLHYPIALAVMTAVAELLYSWRRNPLYNHAAQFMLVAAAILVIPTMLTGLALGEESQFPTDMANIFWWHRVLGVATALWMIFTCLLRFRNARGPYLISLAVLVVLVTITAGLGGSLVYGPDSLSLR